MKTNVKTKTVKSKSFYVTVFAAMLAVMCTTCEFEFSQKPEPGADIIPVEEITGVPSGGRPFNEVILSGTVVPADATNKWITWTIKDNGASATIERNRLTANAYGAVTVTATIANGSGAGVDYTQDFEIKISEQSTVTVKSVNGVPSKVLVGEYEFKAWISPSNTSSEIAPVIKWRITDWLVPDWIANDDRFSDAPAPTITAKRPFDDEKPFEGDEKVTITSTVPGTLTVTATVTNGLLGGDYTREFKIRVYGFVESITGIPSRIPVGDEYFGYWFESGLKINPSDALKNEITFTLKSAGTTGAQLLNYQGSDCIRTTAPGTLVITATIEYGLLSYGDFTQDFEIEVYE